MQNPPSLVGLINENIELAKSYGILHVSVDNVSENGRFINVKGQQIVNFNSCSYLGLETDSRLIASAHEVIDKIGVHFSSSRSYLGLSLYEEAEDLLAKIFGKPVIITPSTTLGHMALLPLLVQQDDYMILDQQVHSSVAFSVQQVVTKPGHIEKIRHNRLEYLENRINKLSNGTNKVWYFADGVYSMYGDVAPLEDLMTLVEKYEHFHIYLDDAHGMSWAGENGKGYVMDKIKHHPRIQLTTSLGKGFGTSGGAIICQSEEHKTFIRNCGGTLIFSGPLQPANLGAAIASAKIHLTPEIYGLQQALKERIDFFQAKAEALGLPLVSIGKTPLFYIGTGTKEVGCEVISGLMRQGAYTCIASYPSVPATNSGIRILVNVHQTLDDIDQMLSNLAPMLFEQLEKSGIPLNRIYKAFGKDAVEVE
ncbi:MAG: aminotransferase class I/II-fold pyridoxal phosphate-dependent enzyme [Saprospiraceae bacterium]|nr:aminotransferase class I/II-fold pyridoxal phosphate-dependent enzyme [Saprospiraceae bacterium]